MVYIVTYDPPAGRPAYSHTLVERIESEFPHRHQLHESTWIVDSGPHRTEEILRLLGPVPQGASVFVARLAGREWAADPKPSWAERINQDWAW